MLVNLMDVLSADKPHSSKENIKKRNKYQVPLWDLEKNVCGREDPSALLVLSNIH